MVPDDNECQVCREKLLFRNGNCLLTSPGCCGKTYHAKCFQNILDSSSSPRCPNCRKPIQLEEKGTAANEGEDNGDNNDEDEAKHNGPATWNEIMNARDTWYHTVDIRGRLRPIPIFKDGNTLVYFTRSGNKSQVTFQQFRSFAKALFNHVDWEGTDGHMLSDRAKCTGSHCACTRKFDLF